MQDGTLISILRQNKDIKQIDIARLLKVSLSTYKLYEANLRVMKLPELNILSNYFNVSINALLGLTKDTNSFNESVIVNYKFLKYNIKILRKRYNLKQADLAKDFNMSINTISKFECEPRHINSVYLYKLAKKFDISIDFICGKTLERDIA